jgi:hypothetical protein
LIELNRGLARLDLPDFELASRNDVDALGAFLEANGMTVVDPPGEYYGRSYYCRLFHRPRRHEARSHGVQAAAEAAPGGGRGKPTAFTAHALELHSPLLITTGNKGIASAAISHSRRLVLQRVPGAAQHE